MSDLILVAILLVLAVILDVTAMRFGHDSRDGFRLDTTHNNLDLNGPERRFYDYLTARRDAVAERARSRAPSRRR